MPRRHRLRGGVRDAAAAARLPAQLDLGGIRQRVGARRAEPDALPALLAECEQARGANAALDAHLDRLAAAAPSDPDFEARGVVSELALGLQASLLVRHAPSAVADAFCAGRLGAGAGRTYGTLPAGVDTEAILERVLAA